VNEIPTVVLLERSEKQGGAFTPMRNGFAGVELLRGTPPQTLAADFPWAARKVLQFVSRQRELERVASLVVLCEQLEPLSDDFFTLDKAMEKVAHDFLGRQEVARREWPSLKFAICCGGVTKESRVFREACGLPPAEREPLQVILLDKRWQRPYCYHMRGVCQVLKWPFDLPAISGNGGKRLFSFLEEFCTRIQPNPRKYVENASSPFHKPPVRTDFGHADVAPCAPVASVDEHLSQGTPAVPPQQSKKGV